MRDRAGACHLSSSWRAYGYDSWNRYRTRNRRLLHERTPALHAAHRRRERAIQKLGILERAERELDRVPGEDGLDGDLAYRALAVAEAPDLSGAVASR